MTRAKPYRDLYSLCKSGLEDEISSIVKGGLLSLRVWIVLITLINFSIFISQGLVIIANSKIAEEIPLAGIAYIVALIVMCFTPLYVVVSMERLPASIRLLIAAIIIIFWFPTINGYFVALLSLPTTHSLIVVGVLLLDILILVSYNRINDSKTATWQNVRVWVNDILSKCFVLLYFWLSSIFLLFHWVRVFSAVLWSWEAFATILLLELIVVIAVGFGLWMLFLISSTPLSILLLLLPTSINSWFTNDAFTIDSAVQKIMDSVDTAAVPWKNQNTKDLIDKRRSNLDSQIQALAVITGSVGLLGIVLNLQDVFKNIITGTLDQIMPTEGIIFWTVLIFFLVSLLGILYIYWELRVLEIMDAVWDEVHLLPIDVGVPAQQEGTI